MRDPHALFSFGLADLAENHLITHRHAPPAIGGLLGFNEDFFYCLYGIVGRNDHGRHKDSLKHHAGSYLRADPLLFFGWGGHFNKVRV